MDCYHYHFPAPPPFPNEENITGVWGVVELKRRLLFH